MGSCIYALLTTYSPAHEDHSIKSMHSASPSRDLTALSRTIATSLGIPPVAFNPLLERTFAAHLRVCRYQSVLESL